MLNKALCTLLILVASPPRVQAFSWQRESGSEIGTLDSSKAVITPGKPKGGIAYHIKDMDEGRFRACIEAFAQHYSFKPIYARSRTWLDGRSFVDIWYHRDNGALFNVPDHGGEVLRLFLQPERWPGFRLGA